jgi:hypothetical protein
VGQRVDAESRLLDEEDAQNTGIHLRVVVSNQSRGT